MSERKAKTACGHTLGHVYIIRSEAFPGQDYTGATADLKRRMADHNAGKSKHTAKYIPWKLVWYSAFSDKYKALDFERYLKSRSAGPLPRRGYSFARWRALRLGKPPKSRLKILPMRGDLLNRVAPMRVR